MVAYQAEFSWHPKVEPRDYDFIISASDGYTTDTAYFTITVHPEIDLSMNQTKYRATIDKVFTTQFIIEQVPRSHKFTYDLINITLLFF